MGLKYAINMLFFILFIYLPLHIHISIIKKNPYHAPCGRLYYSTYARECPQPRHYHHQAWNKIKPVLHAPSSESTFSLVNKSLNKNPAYHCAMRQVLLLAWWWWSSSCRSSPSRARSGVSTPPPSAPRSPSQRSWSSSLWWGETIIIAMHTNNGSTS